MADRDNGAVGRHEMIISFYLHDPLHTQLIRFPRVTAFVLRFILAAPAPFSPSITRPASPLSNENRRFQIVMGPAAEISRWQKKECNGDTSLPEQTGRFSFTTSIQNTVFSRAAEEILTRTWAMATPIKQRLKPNQCHIS